MSAPRESRRTRFLFGGFVLVSTALAAVAAGAVTWLAERPGLHKRFDLTFAGSNTLAPALAELIDKLPERVYVETFFEQRDDPLLQVRREVQGRTAELLFIAQSHAPAKLKVIEHDLTDLASAEAAMRELGLEETNVVVVHAGKQRAVLRLLTDLARVDLGNPNKDQFVPPHITSYRGEEALARALKRVSQGRAPRILFAQGHAERDPFGSEDRQLGRLERLLVNDGFEVATWDFKAAELPADCDVLVVVDPKQPFRPAERASIEAFVARGGRLLAAPGAPVYDAPGGLVELLGRYGVEVRPGYAAAPVANPAGLYQGLPACGDLSIGPEGLERSHPITEPLWRIKYTVWFPLTRTLALRRLPDGGVSWPLVSTDRTAWLDAEKDGAQDWTLDPVREPRGPFVLCYALELPAPAAPPSDEELAKARILVVGTPEALNNVAIEERRQAPFLLNAFNWLTSREYRITIPTRADDRRILEVKTTSNLRVFHSIAVILLPGLCAALGLGLWWWRRR